MAQHDQVINDGTGAVVRFDINQALAALFSNSSGPIEPTVKVPGQWWYDTGVSPAVMRQRNNDNSAWVDVPVGFDPNNVWTKGESYSKSQADAAIAKADSDNPLYGDPEKIINGFFDYWGGQFSSASPSGAALSIPATTGVVYAADRMIIQNTTNVACTVVPVLTGNLDPGDAEPSRFKMRIAFASMPTSGDIFILQRIEGVETLAGRKATAQLQLTDSAASGPMDTLSCYVQQVFGTGGSPSASVITNPTSLDIATIGHPTTTKRKAIFDIPSIVGKTYGTAGNDYLVLVWKLTPRSPAPFNIDISAMSLLPGDQRALKYLPRRPLQQEVALCQRYFQFLFINHLWYASVGTAQQSQNQTYPVLMRASPSVGALQANPEASQTATNNSAQGALNGTPRYCATYITATAAGAVAVYGYRWALSAEYT